MKRVLLLVGVLLLAMGCGDSTHTLVSPECPPDDSLAFVRHPLGCGVYQTPPDTVGR